MAIDLCSENSGVGISPRISFSHDLSQSDILPVEQHLLRSISSSSVNFDFCVEVFDHESSLADEIFSNGKILPIQVKKKICTTKKKESPSPPPPPPPPLPLSVRQNVAKGSKNESLEVDDKKQYSKSFWGFKRSSSLNCGSGYARSLCPLPLLSRSNSTGSKESLNHKHQHSQRTPFLGSTKQSQSSSSATSFQKPPLKKTSAYGSYGNGGIRINIHPVLNVPSANLFGMVFSSNKDKNRKK